MVWSRQLTEEFGRVTGYGGRIVSPIFDSGLVIVGMVNANWGDQARGLNRFVAFDGKTGEVVWWSTPTPGRPSTGRTTPTRSSPSSTASGSHRRRGRRRAPRLEGPHRARRSGATRSARAFVNASPVVDGNLVYSTTARRTPRAAPLGRVICVDGSVGGPEDEDPEARLGHQAAGKYGTATSRSPARFGLADGSRCTLPRRLGEMHCFDARKTAKVALEVRYAAEVRGSPLIADGKLYIFDVKARIAILTLDGDKRPMKPTPSTIASPAWAVGFIETNGTPIAVNGRVYFHADRPVLRRRPSRPSRRREVQATRRRRRRYKENAIAGVRLFPADVSPSPARRSSSRSSRGRERPRGEGQPARPPAVEWTLPLPPKTPAGASRRPSRGRSRTGR